MITYSRPSLRAGADRRLIEEAFRAIQESLRLLRRAPDPPKHPIPPEKRPLPGASIAERPPAPASIPTWT